FARMYDRNVSMLEAQQIARLLSLAQALGMSEFVQTLAGGSGLNQNQVAVQFIINLLVLRHEAGRLGLRPDGSEIADVVRKLPAFQSESGFDMNKFSEFVRNALGPMGLGEEHIEQLVRDELCLNEIKRLLAAGISICKSSPIAQPISRRRYWKKARISSRQLRNLSRRCMRPANLRQRRPTRS